MSRAKIVLLGLYQLLFILVFLLLTLIADWRSALLIASAFEILVLTAAMSVYKALMWVMGEN